MKLFVFDLDGVLIDFCELHRNAFLGALSDVAPHIPVNIEYHEKYLEARSTKAKLKILVDQFGPFNTQAVSDRKQALTLELVEKDLRLDERRVQKALLYAKSMGLKLACYSNSIRATVETCLKKLAIYDLFDCVKSNEDVPNSKPDPVGYEMVMKELGISPEDTLIFEDSEVGLRAARNSKAHVMRIINSLDLTEDFLKMVWDTLHQPDLKTILDEEGMDLRDYLTYQQVKHLNVVIPMVNLDPLYDGRGHRKMKALIVLSGMPIFKIILENVLPKRPFLAKKVSFHLLVGNEHVAELQSWPLARNVHVHPVYHPTDGAAKTVLLIKPIIDSLSSLLIVNCNQFLEWSIDDFYDACFHPSYDGLISTFENPFPKDLRWSYAKVDVEGKLIRVAEKQFIGPDATTGIYFWKKGYDFVKHAEETFQANNRVNGQFYVCPVYNYSVQNGGRIRVMRCSKFWSFNTQHDFDLFRHAKETKVLNYSKL